MLVLGYQSWYMGTDRRWAALVWTVNVAKLLAVSFAKLLVTNALSGGPTGRSWCAAVALKGRVLVIGGEQSGCEKVCSR